MWQPNVNIRKIMVYIKEDEIDGEYCGRVIILREKLDDDTVPDKIKLDILNLFEQGDKVAPCKKCKSWFQDLIKLSQDVWEEGYGK